MRFWRRIDFLLFLGVFMWLGVGASHSREFHVDRIQPITFVETKLTGEKTEYRGYNADIIAWPDASINEMYAYSEIVKKERLLSMAENNDKKAIFITFYMNKTVINDQTAWQTFRVIYLRDDLGWRRLNK